MSVSGDLVSSAIANIDKADADFRAARAALDEVPIDGATGFDPERPLNRLDLPLSLVPLRLKTILCLLRALPSDLPLATVPLSLFKSILSHSGVVASKVRDLCDHIDKVKANGGFKQTTWADIEIGASNGTVNGQFVSDFVQPLIDNTDHILAAYNQQLAVVGPAGSLDFRYALENVAKTLTATEEAARAAGDQMRTTGQAAILAAEARAKAEAAFGDIARNQADAKRTRDEIAVIEGDIRTKKGEADATLSAASALKAQVESYSSTFDAFQHSLADRNTAWTTGETHLADLVMRLDLQDVQIKDTIDRAKGMLATATNAGLTAAQETKFDQLNTDLVPAGRAVNISFALLFLSLSPLAAYVIGNWNSTVQFSGSLEYAANLFLRVALLFPALLFVGFTTTRYRRLFRLKHDYGFRASLAGAVEGFKAQAPEHGQDIAAVAFFQLGRNPAESIDGETDDPAWYQKLLEVIVRFGDRFGKTPASPG